MAGRVMTMEAKKDREKKGEQKEDYNTFVDLRHDKIDKGEKRAEKSAASCPKKSLLN